MSEFIRKEFLRFIYQFILNKKYSTAGKLIDFLIENDKDIDVRLIKNILRRPHPCLDIPAQQADNHSHNHCEYCSQPAAVGHIPAHGTLILFAKLLCYRNSKTTADTVAEADDHKVDGAC